MLIGNMHGLFVPLKDKNGITITTGCQKTLEKPKSKGLKQSKVWIDKGNEFDSRSMKS